MDLPLNLQKYGKEFGDHNNLLTARCIMIFGIVLNEKTTTTTTTTTIFSVYLNTRRGTPCLQVYHFFVFLSEISIFSHVLTSILIFLTLLYINHNKAEVHHTGRNLHRQSLRL